MTSPARSIPCSGCSLAEIPATLNDVAQHARDCLTRCPGKHLCKQVKEQAVADLVLIRFDKTRTRAANRELIKRLRDAALAVFPKGSRQGTVATINSGRFKIKLRTGDGTVDAQGAHFDLDEPDFDVVRLVYELAKAGAMAWVDSWGPTSTIVFDRATVKALPGELRRPRPIVCTSARHLARMMGVSPNAVSAKADPRERPWTRGFARRARFKLPGIQTPKQERYAYVQILPDEDIDLMMKRLWAFIRAGKKDGTFQEPTGGGIAFNHWDDWQLRLPTGQVLVPWHVAGYESRPNADHLVPANLEAWMSLARQFARASRRKIATIADGKTLVVQGGGRYPINRLEHRRFKVE